MDSRLIGTHFKLTTEREGTVLRHEEGAAIVQAWLAELQTVLGVPSDQIVTELAEAFRQLTTGELTLQDLPPELAKPFGLLALQGLLSQQTHAADQVLKVLRETADDR